MSLTLVIVSSASILIPAICGIYRINKISKVYFPFLLCIWIGTINELLNHILIDKLHGSNAINTNIYCLIESLFLTWQFKRWELFARAKIIYYSILALLLTSWVTNVFVISKITLFASYFIVTYSFIFVLMSVTMINMVLIRRSTKLLQNSIFLICFGLTFFYTFSVLIEIFWLYGLNSSRNFTTEVYRIMDYINILVNLIFAVAIVWMEKKEEFSLPP